MIRRSILISTVSCAVSATAALIVALSLPHPSAAAGTPSATPRHVQPRGNGRPSPIPLGVDGCDHNYIATSAAQVCVPLMAPGGKPVDCTYLATLHMPALRVLGVDDMKLAGGGRAAKPGQLVCPSR